MERILQDLAAGTPASTITRQISNVAPALRIAPAHLHDFDVVAHLFEAVRGYNASLDHRFALDDNWREHLRELFQRTYADPATSLWLLAWNGAEPVGLLVIAAHVDSPLLKHRRWAEVQALYVAPECRGTGLAQQLIAAGRSWAATQRFDRLQVHAAAANEHARSFYRRSGFQSVQEVLCLTVPAYLEGHAA